MTKLILKCGAFEVEYEGDEKFLKNELPALIENIAQLQSGTVQQAPPAGVSARVRLGGSSVSTVAQKLGVKKGTDLVMAAALTLSSDSDVAFTKKQLRDRSREATTYWKASYGNNFDNYVARLIKRGRINHTGGDNYALPNEEKTELTTKLTA